MASAVSLRFKRLWFVFAFLALAYSAFQFAVFTPLNRTADLRLEQFAFPLWHWPPFSEVWRESLLHTLESVAGIFDAAATTFPLSVIAAVLLICELARTPSSAWCAPCAGSSVPAAG